MKAQHDGQLLPVARGRRHVDDVGARAAVVVERDAMVARLEPGRRGGGNEQAHDESQERAPSHSTRSIQMSARRLSL